MSFCGHESLLHFSLAVIPLRPLTGSLLLRRLEVQTKPYTAILAQHRLFARRLPCDGGQRSGRWYGGTRMGLIVEGTVAARDE